MNSLSSQSQPLVSVIIPTRNRARLLGETLASIARQSYGRIEVIIVDDGGNDGTKDLAGSVSGLVYHWQSPQGVSAARNTGFRLSSGSYLQFLDSDDLLECEKIMAQASYLNSHAETDIVYGDARYFTTESPSLRAYNLLDHPEVDQAQPWIKPRWEEPGQLPIRLIRKNLMPICCPLARREAIETIGPWNEKMAANEDWEFWLRGAVCGLRFHFLEAADSMSLIRTHRASATWQMERMSLLSFRLELARQLQGEYGAENYRQARYCFRDYPWPYRMRYQARFLRAAGFAPVVVREMLRRGLADKIRRFTDKSSN